VSADRCRIQDQSPLGVIGRIWTVSSTKPQRPICTLTSVLHSALCTLRNTVGATCCGGPTNNAAPSSPRSRPALVYLTGFALAPLTVGSPPKISKPTTEHKVSNRPSYEPELRSKLLSPALPSQEPSVGALLKIPEDQNGYRPNGRTSDCPPPKRQHFEELK